MAAQISGLPWLPTLTSFTKEAGGGLGGAETAYRTTYLEGDQALDFSLFHV
jgi:hypothetical protein